MQPLYRYRSLGRTRIKPPNFCHLAFGLAALCTAGCAAANDAPPSAVSKLAQTGALSCQPTLPFFCGNLHVACAGQTSIETFAFTLRATLTNGAIEPAGAPGGDANDVRKQYENSRVDWDKAGAHVTLRPRLADNGYVQLRADGSYVFRHYPQNSHYPGVSGQGVMSLGRCR